MRASARPASTCRAENAYQPVDKIPPPYGQHNMLRQSGLNGPACCGAEHGNRFCQRAVIGLGLSLPLVARIAALVPRPGTPHAGRVLLQLDAT